MKKQALFEISWFPAAFCTVISLLCIIYLSHFFLHKIEFEKIEFLRPNNGGKKVLEKYPAERERMAIFLVAGVVAVANDI